LLPELEEVFAFSRKGEDRSAWAVGSLPAIILPSPHPVPPGILTRRSFS
jgi:hypothetical protein